MRARSLAAFLVSVSFALFSAALRAQTTASPEEIPIERCDHLPVVTIKVAGESRRFLLDTAATTILFQAVTFRTWWDRL